MSSADTRVARQPNDKELEEDSSYVDSLFAELYCYSQLGPSQAQSTQKGEADTTMQDCPPEDDCNKALEPEGAVASHQGELLQPVEGGDSEGGPRPAKRARRQDTKAVEADNIIDLIGDEDQATHYIDLTLD